MFTFLDMHLLRPLLDKLEIFIVITLTDMCIRSIMIVVPSLDSTFQKNYDLSNHTMAFQTNWLSCKMRGQ